MSDPKKFIKSTVGMKILMAVTGLLLVGFLTSHLAGNFLLFDSIGGKEAFNNYAHWLVTHPLIIPMEIGLFALFLIHIITAFKVSMAAKAARPEAYACRENLGKSTFASRTMLQTGSIIFIFLVLHLSTFKFGSEYTAESKVEGVKLEEPKRDISKTEKNAQKEKLEEFVKNQKKPVRDLHRTVVENFQKPWYSIIYILCMIAMGVHLCHGIRSACQTLGLNHPKYNCCIERCSCLLAILFALAYSIFPVYFGFIFSAGGQ